MILIGNFFNNYVEQQCLHRFLRLLFHKTLKGGFYIQNNFKRSYNICVLIYFVWVLVHFCDPHAQSMLPNSIRLLEAPFQHLNLKQTRHGKLRLLAVLPSFPPSSFSRYLPWSRKILAMFPVNWYFVWGTFFWKFLQLKWLQPWAFFRILLSSCSIFVFSSLYFSED